MDGWFAIAFLASLAVLALLMWIGFNISVGYGLPLPWRWKARLFGGQYIVMKHASDDEIRRVQYDGNSRAYVVIYGGHYRLDDPTRSWMPLNFRTEEPPMRDVTPRADVRLVGDKR